MKWWISTLIILTISGNISIFAKGKINCNSDEKFVVVTSKMYSRLELLGLSVKQFDALPEDIKQRIPDRLTRIDSLLIDVDFQKVTADENHVTNFSSGELSGKIIKMERRIFKVIDDQDHLLAVFRKSRDGKRYTLINAKGEILYNSHPFARFLLTVVMLLVISYTLIFIFFLAILKGS